MKSSASTHTRKVFSAWKSSSGPQIGRIAAIIKESTRGNLALVQPVLFLAAATKLMSSTQTALFTKASQSESPEHPRYVALVRDVLVAVPLNRKKSPAPQLIVGHCVLRFKDLKSNIIPFLWECYQTVLGEYTDEGHHAICLYKSDIYIVAATMLKDGILVNLLTQDAPHLEPPIMPGDYNGFLEQLVWGKQSLYSKHKKVFFQEKDSAAIFEDVSGEMVVLSGQKKSRTKPVAISSSSSSSMASTTTSTMKIVKTTSPKKPAPLQSDSSTSESDSSEDSTHRSRKRKAAASAEDVAPNKKNKSDPKASSSSSGHNKSISSSSSGHHKKLISSSSSIQHNKSISSLHQQPSTTDISALTRELVEMAGKLARAESESKHFKEKVESSKKLVMQQQRKLEDQEKAIREKDRQIAVLETKIGQHEAQPGLHRRPSSQSVSSPLTQQERVKLTSEIGVLKKANADLNAQVGSLNLEIMLLKDEQKRAEESKKMADQYHTEAEQLLVVLEEIQQLADKAVRDHQQEKTSGINKPAE